MALGTVYIQQSCYWPTALEDRHLSIPAHRGRNQEASTVFGNDPAFSELSPSESLLTLETLVPVSRPSLMLLWDSTSHLLLRARPHQLHRETPASGALCAGALQSTWDIFSVYPAPLTHAAKDSMSPPDCPCQEVPGSHGVFPTSRGLPRYSG